MGRYVQCPCPTRAAGVVVGPRHHASLLLFQGTIGVPASRWTLILWWARIVRLRLYRRAFPRSPEYPDQRTDPSQVLLSAHVEGPAGSRGRGWGWGFGIRGLLLFWMLIWWATASALQYISYVTIFGGETIPRGNVTFHYAFNASSSPYIPRTSTTDRWRKPTGRFLQLVVNRVFLDCTDHVDVSRAETLGIATPSSLDM